VEIVTSEQVRAARALLRWEQKDLAAATKISLPTIKRLETIRGDLPAQARTIEAFRLATVPYGDECGVETWRVAPVERVLATHVKMLIYSVFLRYYLIAAYQKPCTGNKHRH
jgi:hypothetical protein